MSLPVYCINLDRSIDRWHRMHDAARALGIDMQRVAGVNGTALAPHERVHADEALFESRNGRKMLAGEYGCYRSHLLALETFLAGDADAAIIIEDDVELNADLVSRAQAALQAVPKAGVIRLLNHRSKGFVKTATSLRGDDVGRCLHGPQGSAACYLVTRSGATRLLRSIATMSLPYDMALERGWETGVPTYTVRHNLAELGPLRSLTEIGTLAQYAGVKRRGISRMPTHLFRAVDYGRRLAYVAKG